MTTLNQPRPSGASLSRGAEMIAQERHRQITIEGYGAKHDDAHVESELVLAARAYLRRVLFLGSCRHHADMYEWPFEPKFFKPGTNRIQALAKAGAFIAAEIDRLIRAEEKSS